MAEFAPRTPTVTVVQGAATPSAREAAGPEPGVPFGKLPPWDPRALAMVGFSSGSTGRPKGIRMPGRLLDFGLRASVASVFEPEPPRLLATTPLSHSVALMADGVLGASGTVFLHEQFEVGAVLEAVARHRISRTFMATSHLYQLLDHRDCRTAGLSSLMLLSYTGSAAAPARLADAVEVFGMRLL